MRSDWQIKKLSDIALINPRENIPLGKAAKKVPMNKLRPFCRDVSEYEIEEYSGGVKFRNGDTIMARITPCLENGKAAKINFLEDDEIAFGSTEYIVFRAIYGQCDEDFLYYLITSPIVREPAIKSMVGSSGRQRVQTDVVKNLEIAVPTVKDQKIIAGLFRLLDDKIAINNKINQNLEQQLDALYKSWFVDLSPFDGAAPSSWKYGKLKDILKQKRDSVKPGLYTNLPYLPIDSIPMNSLALNEVRPNEEALSSLVRFKKNDILIGAMRVYFHRVALAPFDGITRSTCFTLEPYNLNFLSFALLVCNQDTSIEYAQRTSKGSTMPYAIWDGGLGDMELLVPTEDDATSFNELALPLLSKIQSSYFENTRLQNLRDILLPKLMSGELDISELDI